MDKNLLRLFFPAGLLDYFEVVSYTEREQELIFLLEEMNIPPDGFVSNELESKGFYEGGQITDFPLQGKKCLSQIRRRKWMVKADNRVITRDWNVVATGTKMTKKFATFLKELNR